MPQYIKSWQPMQAGSYKLPAAWGPSLLFVVIYALAYGPYFLYAPLPDVQQDSYIYFWAASLIRDGIIPFPKFTVDVPVGHPVFIWLVKTLAGKTTTIITVQNLLFTTACVYIITCFGKINAKYAWITAIALSLYSIDNFTMRMNTSLYSECLYTSLLIFVAARMVIFFSGQTPSSLVYLVLSLLLPGLVRPNGIYIFFLVAPVALFVWKQKLPVKYWYNLFGSLVIVFVLWSGINYCFKGIFLPSDPYRIAYVINRGQAAKSTNHPSETKPSKTSKAQLFLQNLTSISASKPSFYFTFLNDRYSYLYEKPMYADPSQKLFNLYRVDSVAPALKTYLFGEFMGVKPPAQVKDLCDLKNTERSKWMMLNHVIYRVFDILVWNSLWIVAFCITGMWWLFNLLRAEKANSLAYLLFSLFCMHFVSILIVTIGHNRFQTRYPHVTEVFLLLTVLLSLYFFTSQKIQKTQ